MSLTGILDLLGADRAVSDVLRIARDGGEPLLDLTGPPGLRAPLAAALAAPPPQGAGRTVLAVTATGREAEDLAGALRCFLPEHSVAEFGAWETLPHERLSPRSDTVGRRIAVLRRLAHPEQDEHGPVRVVVAPVRAVLQPVVRGLGDLEPVALHAGQEAELTEVVERLAAAAYSRTDLVERRGEFAVRGGILDVFPPTEEHPLRVEFWGDEVEEVRYFAVADQRSLHVAESGLWAPPCRELLLTDSVRQKAAELAERLPGVADLLGKVAAGIAVEGMESLTPVLVDAMESVLDVLPEGTHVLLADPERIRARAHDLVATSEEFLQASWLSAAAGSAVPVDLEPVLGTASFWSLADVRAHALKRALPWWTVSPFGLDETGQAAHDEGDEGALVLVPQISAPEPYRGDRERTIADIGGWLHEGWRVVVITEGSGLARRVVEMLTEADLAATAVEDLSQPPASSVVAVGTGRLTQGFIAPELKLAVLTETDLTGGSAPGSTTKDMRRMPARRKNVVDPMQLTTGDNVVHEQHGVGKFVELVQRTVAGATREYLVIEYAPSKRGQPGDRLFVPTDALDQVTRYVGGEQPSLNKLGGSDWAKTKGRARKAVKQIAGELIQLYSARMATSGHAFGPDTPWQRELEDAFAYVETPDQLVTIEEVKRDMEKTVPMDRLICGDVGYGKTEIAVRAAFKAVQDGKQVAVLVPTTLLVQQHLDTFVERYVNFPVNVKGLSRFSTEAEARAVKEGITDGSVDVVIGTHRLLTGEIKFKDLGLVVIDEEQRFGVEHKERLKQLRTNVDVLAMSATPIPRTLELAVTGIREMSTLATPPEERHPVLTFVGGYDERQISAAIRRELLREGQVFFIHNRVESIDRTAARLHELVPEARIATAHGKMGEHQLEQVMVDFWEKRFDVLVCTTIIETGLDISNANTLILERADMMGLSQLHQLRGRVGRGRERAYAYFLYPAEKPLTETALDRLQTIAANTDLGAGMRVAMKDLEIRGAGNLLGGEQSGHIAGVGFDLYIRLVGEAVAEFRGENEQEHHEVKIDLPVDAHLPTAYLPDERLRLEAYRKLAEVASDEALDAVKAELVDRYGPLPDVVTNLLEVARLRILARQAGLTEIATMGKAIRFGPIDLPDSARLRLHRLYPGTQDKPATKTVLVPGPTTARIGGRPLRDVAVLNWAREFIESVLLSSVKAAAAVGSRK
ncbi:transcription-repair coupling factor [Kineosporia rhizophila]|uniref:transcription-repair coupling factor n=1 Tax=Kineosporia TaxID=49184 RepID=UPI001E4D09DB|nr:MULTISPECIES: transcription-repair coupling factor [Kineosporia]MCE0535079.1 transcription-repair coupling factor [Kineosporia rhizophila]GLY14637.1 transcription-repair-coupling factor [Kineosporia sp. NBRC 101677]